MAGVGKDKKGKKSKISPLFSVPPFLPLLLPAARTSFTKKQKKTNKRKRSK